MFYKMIVILIMLRALAHAIPGGTENIDWTDFLDEKRSIYIDVDRAINNKVQRANAINAAFHGYVAVFRRKNTTLPFHRDDTLKAAFHSYVAEFRSKNTTLPFNLMINSTEYLLIDANSTITLDYSPDVDKESVFQAKLKFQSLLKKKIKVPFIDVELTCLLFDLNHRCTAHYVGSTPQWVEMLWFFAFMILILLIGIFCCCTNREISPGIIVINGDQMADLPHGRLPIPENIELESLNSQESGYDSPRN